MKTNDEIVIQPKDKGVVAVYRTKRQMMLANLLGGLAWGFGSVMGATLLVALLVLSVQLLGGVPLIGNILQDLIEALNSAPST